MSDTEATATIKHDNKDIEKSNISEPASPDTALHMYAAEDEEKDVRGSVLHKKEEPQTRRSEIDVEIAIEKTIQDVIIFGPNEKYTSCCCDVGRREQGQNIQGVEQALHGRRGSRGQLQPGKQPYGQNLWIYSYGDGDTLDYSSGDDSDRNIFVRKVTIILLIALLITAIFVITVLVVPPLKHFFRALSLPILIFSGVGLLAMTYVMPCCDCARRPPTNYICLLIVIILQCLFCSAVTTRYKTHIVLWTLITTVIVVFICVILACTSFDFTKWIIYIIAISTALCALGLIMFISRVFFGVYSKPLHIALSFAMALVAVVSLLVDLQMVLGGKSIEITEDDYVLGAYMLYMSIIDIFLRFLSLISLLDS